MSSHPLERGITRRHLIRTGISAATIGLSPLLSSCLVDSQDKARVNAWAKDPSTAPTVIAGLRTPAAGPATSPARTDTQRVLVSPTTIPTKESKELTTSPIVLLPINVSEDPTPFFPYLKNKDCQWFTEKGAAINRPEQGWKYVNIQFAVENKSKTTQPVLVDLNSSINGAKLTSKDGFQYGVVHGNVWAGCGVAQDASYTFFNNTQGLPPGFRAIGVYDDSIGTFASRPSPNHPLTLVNKLSFRVGEKTSDYTLYIPTGNPEKVSMLPGLNLGMFPPVDLTKRVLTSLKFPTDRPDSEFRNMGTTIPIPNKGSVTLEGVVNRTDVQTFSLDIKDAGGSKVTLRFRFNNDSKGAGQTFKLTMRLFGDDGILYTKFSTEKILPDQPLSWDGFLVLTDEIAPGQQRVVDGNILTSSTLESGKLVIAGDINEIFNIQLPSPK